MPRRVLFLCTRNSCRSQMAEAILRHLGRNEYEVYSAGVDPADEIHPLAVEIMREKGIDISSQRPKSIEDMMGIQFHRVITVCDNANEHCPYFPGAERIHWPFDDPSQAEGAYEEKMRCFRTVYRELYNRLSFWLEIDRRREEMTSEEVVYSV